MQALHPATLLIARVALFFPRQNIEPFVAIAATILVTSLIGSGPEMRRLLWCTVG